ncbi:hypothetical protein [Mesorhizobium sp. B2-3-5]|uniref:hypothetical protein n=1 Tax=Mesorhizobium sp. B2-3-5 TaxID=2589958 RepID=UPI00112CBBA3|nr:hypothetical protein [Mesorhizobium sp. B2-3-5]TPM16301.1 hypothetical protein FJ958_29300 [Mesorhizobium sp. B2-3-5]
MKSYRTYAYITIVALAVCVVGINNQAVAQPTAVQFTQAFYDWYGPAAFKNADQAYAAAISDHASEFDPRLLEALREDLAAQSKVSGEIVGLDFDPFLFSQDPAEFYQAGKSSNHGGVYSVELHEVVGAKPSTATDVTAQIEIENGSWRFVNFVYPDGNDLLKVLEILKSDRESPAK